MISRPCHASKFSEDQGFTRDTVLQELERVCASEPFRKSQRQKRFLTFVVEQTLAGNSGSIKEAVLALEVFDRPSDYDPKVDTIVRVEARRLRAKLAEYYSATGVTDPIRIDLPLGSYVPLFQAATLQAATPVHEDQAATPVQEDNRPRMQFPRWTVAGVLLAATVAAVAGFWIYHRMAPHPPLRVAVLPFQNLSSQADDEVYSDGVTETLTTDLAKIRSLQVISRTSVGRFKNTRQPIREIARELEVNYIVEGSFQRHGDQCRITAQLIRTADDVHVWSEAYDLAFTDILRVERQAASSIVSRVNVALDPSERKILEGQPTSSAEAYDALLKARKISNEYLFLAKQDYYDDADRLLRRALELDPGYVDAIVERALLDGRKFQNTNELQWRDRAEEGFGRALSREPCHPVANAIMASIRLDAGDADAGFRYARRAVDCSPNSPQPHNSLGLVYVVMGFYEAAAGEFRASAAADPLFVSPALNLSYTLLLLNRKADALAAVERAIEIEPQSPVALAALGVAWMENGNLAEARPAWQKAARFAPPEQVSGVRELFQGLEEAAAGRVEPARQLIRRHRADRWMQGVLWGEMYNQLVLECEEPAEVIAVIHRDAFLQSYRTLISDPRTARLRTDPAFRDLLRQRYQVWQSQIAKYGAMISPPPPKLTPLDKFLTTP